MSIRRPILAALCAIALFASAVAGEIRWITAGTDLHPEGIPLRPLPPAVVKAIGDYWASTQPATPAVPPPVTQPVTPPTPVPLTLLAKGKSGLVADGKGRDVQVSGLWVRVDARDPSVPGFNLGASDQAGPDLLTVRNAASATIQDVTLERGGQNLVVQNIAGLVTLRRVRSLDAWATNKGGMFRGQDAYAELIKGPLTIDQCLFDYGGWVPGLPLRERDVYGHDNYLQRGSGPARITDSAFLRASNAGLQLRSGGTVSGCLIVDCGSGLLVFGRGDTDAVSDTVILGGHRYWTGSAWTGNTGLMSWAHSVRLTNVYFVAVPGQAAADPATFAAGEKSFNTACVALSSTYTAQHPDWADPSPQIQCVNVHAFGWPGAAVTRDNRPITVPGFTAHPQAVNIDVANLVQRVRSGQTSVAGAIVEVKRAAGVN